MVLSEILWYIPVHFNLRLSANCEYDQPFTNDFPRADIHEQIAPDLLHQLIKGIFKDHLVTWVGDYLVATYGPAQSNLILNDIDHR